MVCGYSVSWIFFSKHSCKILLILFLSTAFFETFLLIAIATLKFFDVSLSLCETRILGFDFANLKSH